MIYSGCSETGTPCYLWLHLTRKTVTGRPQGAVWSVTGSTWKNVEERLQFPKGENLHPSGTAEGARYKPGRGEGREGEGAYQLSPSHALAHAGGR